MNFNMFVNPWLVLQFSFTFYNLLIYFHSYVWEVFLYKFYPISLDRVVLLSYFIFISFKIVWKYIILRFEITFSIFRSPVSRYRNSFCVLLCAPIMYQSSDLSITSKLSMFFFDMEFHTSLLHKKPVTNIAFLNMMPTQPNYISVNKAFISDIHE